MYEKSEWAEITDEGDHVLISLDGATATIKRFGMVDWQIDVEGDNWYGCPGKVKSKQDAINWVLDEFGIIEDADVSPEPVITT